MLKKKNLTEKEIKAVMLGWQKWMEIAYRLEAGDLVMPWYELNKSSYRWQSDFSIIPDGAEDCELCRLSVEKGIIKCKLCVYYKNYAHQCHKRGGYWYEWIHNPCYETAFALAEKLIKIIFPY